MEVCTFRRFGIHIERCDCREVITVPKKEDPALRMKGQASGAGQTVGGAGAKPPHCLDTRYSNCPVGKVDKMDNQCPKRGVLFMYKFGREYAVRTTCHNWSCVQCRDRVLAVVMAKMEVGILILGECYLITLTFVLKRGTKRGAEYVATVWRRFLKELNRRWPKVEWFKVVELTKKGQPHLHLLMGGFGEKRMGCCGRNNDHGYGAMWKASCRSNPECLEHQISRMWESASGDSWVVDAREVVGAAGASSYLSKYLKKGMYTGRLAEAGFARRYSRSKGWPSGKIGLRGSVVGWDGVVWKGSWELPGDVEARLQKSEGAYLMEVVGHDIVKAIQERRVRKVKAKKILRMLNNDESNR